MKGVQSLVTFIDGDRAMWENDIHSLSTFAATVAAFLFGKIDLWKKPAAVIIVS